MRFNVFVIWSLVIVQVSGLKVSSTGIEDEFKESISAQVDRMFNDAANAHRGHVNVTAASPGAWKNTQACQTPKLWIYISGMYREFNTVRGTLKEMASRSSDDCYFVSAVVADESGMYTKMVEAQAFFGGRMAFTIISRQGMYDRGGDHTIVWEPPSSRGEMQALQPMYDVYWYLLQQNIKFAAPMIDVVPKPSSVLIRTRFDIRWETYYTLENLTKTFESSLRGLHLAFANTALGGQGDYSFMTSYSAYKTDIAEAYEYDPETKTGPFPSTARSNSWGYGYSLCGFRAHGKCADQTDSAFVDIGKSHYCQEKASGQLEKECCAGGRACALTILWSQHLTVNADIGHVNGNTLAPMAGPFDLTKSVRLYCPDNQDRSYEYDHPKIGAWIANYGGQFYVSKNAEDLVDTESRVVSPWPRGC